MRKQSAAVPSSIEKLAQDAARKARKYELSKEAVGQEDGAFTTNQRQYLKELNKVIEASDVIVEVLDARDPLGCRCLQVEKMIMEAGNKKIVLLLNKIDLVPRESVQGWLTYLRGFFPTVAFKASTQTQRQHLGQSTADAEHASEGSCKSVKGLDPTLQRARLAAIDIWRAGVSQRIWRILSTGVP